MNLQPSPEILARREDIQRDPERRGGAKASQSWSKLCGKNIKDFWELPEARKRQEGTVKPSEEC